MPFYVPMPTNNTNKERLTSSSGSVSEDFNHIYGKSSSSKAMPARLFIGGMYRIIRSE